MGKLLRVLRRAKSLFRRYLIRTNRSDSVVVQRQFKETLRHLREIVSGLADDRILQELYSLVLSLVEQREHRIASYEAQANGLAQLLGFFLAPSLAAIPFLFERFPDSEQVPLWFWLYSGSVVALGAVFIGLSVFRSVWPFGAPVRAELPIPQMIANSSGLNEAHYYRIKILEMAMNWVQISLWVQISVRRLWFFRVLSMLLLMAALTGGIGSFLAGDSGPGHGGATSGAIGTSSQMRLRLDSLEKEIRQLKKDHGQQSPISHSLQEGKE